MTEAPDKFLYHIVIRHYLDSGLRTEQLMQYFSINAECWAMSSRDNFVQFILEEVGEGRNRLQFTEVLHYPDKEPYEIPAWMKEQHLPGLYGNTHYFVFANGVPVPDSGARSRVEINYSDTNDLFCFYAAYYKGKLIKTCNTVEDAEMTVLGEMMHVSMTQGHQPCFLEAQIYWYNGFDIICGVYVNHQTTGAYELLRFSTTLKATFWEKIRMFGSQIKRNPRFAPVSTFANRVYWWYCFPSGILALLVFALAFLGGFLISPQQIALEYANGEMERKLQKLVKEAPVFLISTIVNLLLVYWFTLRF